MADRRCSDLLCPCLSLIGNERKDNTHYKPQKAEPIPPFRRLALRWYRAVFPAVSFMLETILQDYQLLPAVI
jgi:hypothetical protein